MNAPKKDLFPISWKTWDEIDRLFHAYYDVEFLENFGVFEAGEKFGCLFVDYAKGEIHTAAEDAVQKNQLFRLAHDFDLAEVALHFKTAESFAKWLGKENPAFGGQKPFDLIKNKKTTELAIMMHRLDHGVFS